MRSVPSDSWIGDRPQRPPVRALSKGARDGSLAGSLLVSDSGRPAKEHGLDLRPVETSTSQVGCDDERSVMSAGGAQVPVEEERYARLHDTRGKPVRMRNSPRRLEQLNDVCTRAKAGRRRRPNVPRSACALPGRGKVSCHAATVRHEFRLAHTVSTLRCPQQERGEATVSMIGFVPLSHSAGRRFCTARMMNAHVYISVRSGFVPVIRGARCRSCAMCFGDAEAHSR